jgi:hypothetical protein
MRLVKSGNSHDIFSARAFERYKAAGAPSRGSRRWAAVRTNTAPHAGCRRRGEGARESTVEGVDGGKDDETTWMAIMVWMRDGWMGGWKTRTWRAADPQ